MVPCCAKKKVFVTASPTYDEYTSLSILKTFSTFHSPPEALSILSLGKVITTSSPYKSLNKRLNDFSLPLDKYSGKTFLIKNALSIFSY